MDLKSIERSYGVDITDQSPDQHCHAEMVGGRQKGRPPQPGGGGYLNNCSRQKLQHWGDDGDFTLDDLRQIGIPSHWIEVADIVGTSAFLHIWQILHEAANDMGDKRIHVPAVTRLDRLRRNRIIKKMAEQKRSWQEIQEALRQCGFDCNYSVILRVRNSPNENLKQEKEHRNKNENSSNIRTGIHKATDGKRHISTKSGRERP